MVRFISKFELFKQARFRKSAETISRCDQLEITDFYIVNDS